MIKNWCKKVSRQYALPVAAFLSIAATGEAFAYGEKVDTLPNWQERAVLVLLNACRMSPVEFRSAYLKSEKILLPANYPPVPPLYWQKELNAAARFHCAEMAGTCGMKHECGGITFDARIRQFYKEGNNLGENIASGYTTPQQAVTAWLLDLQSAGDTAADHTDYDGHRQNIMSKNFTVAGNGYYASGSGKNIKPFWCQDFGSGKSSYRSHPVPSASHLFLAANTTTFMLNNYDTSTGNGSVSLILEGVQHQMERLFSGKGNSGTFAVQLPKAALCRSYFFEVKTGNSQSFRYPDAGVLVTTGEGTCTQDFLLVDGVSPHPEVAAKLTPATSLRVNAGRIFWPSGMPAPEFSTVSTLDGCKTGTAVWHGTTAFLGNIAQGSQCVILTHERSGRCIGYSRIVLQQER